jgi:hypothetical protein
VYAVLGDVVDSKRHDARDELQRRVVEAVATVDRMIPGVQPLEVTVGDEFQGAYARLSDAVRATLLIRLVLLPDVDTRYGIGSGPVTVFDPDRRPLSQDGPAWWAAREAIERVHRHQQRSARERAVRTWFVAGPPDEGATGASELERFVNAHLVCRDALVPRQDERAVTLLRGWLLGRTQDELAAEAGISQSAVSQRLARMGALALRDADDVLAGEMP